MFALLSPEIFLLLVCDRGWTPQRREQWACDVVRSQLLEANGPASPPEPG
jgi:hypothetical protein